MIWMKVFRSIVSEQLEKRATNSACYKGKENRLSQSIHPVSGV